MKLPRRKAAARAAGSQAAWSGRAPSQIADRYAKADAERGRNESCPCGSGRKWKKCHGVPGSHRIPQARIPGT